MAEESRLVIAAALLTALITVVVVAIPPTISIFLFDQQLNVLTID